jgi:hypothetical protein
MTKDALLNRIRRRAFSRGAAMVEGAFMALIFALFFNLMVWCAGLYLAKIQSSELSRYETFYYASHDCKGGVPTYKTLDFKRVNANAPNATPAEEGSDPPSVPPANDPNLGQVAPDQGAFGPGANGQGFTVRHTVSLQFTWKWGGLSWWSQAVNGNGSVVTESYVMCNEGPYGINILSFLANFVQQAWNTVSTALK